MRSYRLWAISFLFAVGCGSSDGGIPAGVAGAANANGGNSAGASIGGATSGAPNGAGSGNTGGASAGRGGAASSSGGASANAGRGGAGSSSGGASANAGRGGAGASAGNGAGGATATGGAGSCVQNIGCKLQAPASSGDLHQDCVDRINQFRTQCACLPALARNKDGEACADQMAEYDAGKNTAHAGYTDKICQPSGAQNECPGYSSNNQVISLCIQQMWDEGPPPMNPCEGDCFQTYGHFINMTTKSSTKVACGFFTTSSGKVWATQNFLR